MAAIAIGALAWGDRAPRSPDGRVAGGTPELTFEAMELAADPGPTIVTYGAEPDTRSAAVVDVVEDQGAEVFVLSTHESLGVDPEELGATKISRAEIARFMSGRRELLPPRITHWIDLI